MELEEAKNNLRAMRLLYGLLERNSLGLQNTTSEDIIATEASISKTPITSQPVASLQVRPVLAANSSHCSLTYPTCSRFPSQKDEQPQSKSPVKKAGPRQSKCSISDKGKSIRKALFNVDEESIIMQKNLVKAAYLFNEKPIFPIKESSHHEQQHSVRTFHVGEHSEQSPDTFNSKAGGDLRQVSETSLPHSVCEIDSNASASRTVEEAQDEGGSISSDLFNAIKRIESRILALQLYSSLVCSKKNGAGAGNKSMHKIANSESRIGPKNEGIEGKRPSYGNSLLEGYGLMNQQANQLSRKHENFTTANVKPIFTGNESLSKVENQIVDPGEDNGITTQRRSQRGEACRPTLLASRREKLLSQNGPRPLEQSMAMVDRFQLLSRSISGKNHSVNQANECIQGIRVPPLNSITAGSANKDKPTRRNPAAQSETHWREKQPLHYHKVPRQALPRRRSSKLKMPPHGYRDRKVLENRGTHKTRASSSDHHESEEEYSSSSCSPARLTSNQSSAVYSSESEGTSDSPRRMVSKIFEDSSREYSDSYSQNDAGSSHRTGSSSSDRSWHRRRGPEKTAGRLGRLKNKLRLIFHHHHHLHHHHHHDEDNNKMSKMDRRHSIWQRIFYGKNKHKLLGKGKSEKTRGGAIVKFSHRKQAGQFYGLVEGILRHIRHSKKRKPSKVVRIKGSRNLKPGNRKKLHWWQMLRRHRGVRLNNGSRFKVGFKSQKRLKN